MTYKSDALAVAHGMAETLFDAGLIDKQTIREFDVACLFQTIPLAHDETKGDPEVS